MPELFVETDCKIEHNGQTFESGGSYLADCSDGYRRGIVYAHADIWGKAGYGKVTKWNGELIARAWFGPHYQGNFCRMQSVSFTLDGIKYVGRYAPDSNQSIKVRSTKKIVRQA